MVLIDYIAKPSFASVATWPLVIKVEAIKHFI
jgi:hypothetical protein